MQTPSYASMVQFFESVRDFLDTRCVLNRDELYCAECSGRIAYASVGFSILEEGLSLAQKEEVWNVSVPYCPSCEPAPRLNGRLHSAHGTLPN